MSVSCNQIDVNREFTAETMPKYYSVYLGVWPQILPSDLPMTIHNFVTKYLGPSYKSWESCSISSSLATQGITDDFICDAIRSFVPNVVYLFGEFRFKDEATMNNFKVANRDKFNFKEN